MGNLATTAQVAAAEIVPIKQDNDKKPHPPMVGEPPPECPMHQKKAKPVASECPINAGGDDINPLNMVRKFHPQFSYVLYYLSNRPNLTNKRAL